ncbi:MAG TPA: N-acyl homoserine lactonase family protein [Novosphingobium sp.]|nr:N-acyl homoserine lactonase family protein [Novosphingobium sp.]
MTVIPRGEPKDMVSLYAFTCGWFEFARKLFVGGDDESRIMTPVPAYLIDHPVGLAVFDTGLGVRYRNVGKMGDFRIDFDESADIATRMRTIGYDPGDVKWIINSHLHVDHCGGNAFIPNATVIVQSKEWAEAKNTGNQFLYNPADFDLGHPILAIDGEHDLYGDGSVMIFPTVGHTPGHQSVRVKLPDGDVVLAGDCCYLKENLDHLNPSPTDMDRAKSVETLRHLAKLRDRGVRIFYGHDTEFWRAVPQGTCLR